jgi:hypothetical protein
MTPFLFPLLQMGDEGEIFRRRFSPEMTMDGMVRRITKKLLAFGGDERVGGWI